MCDCCQLLAYNLVKMTYDKAILFFKLLLGSAKPIKLSTELFNC